MAEAEKDKAQPAWLSTRRAGEILQLSHEHVRRLAIAGKLEGRQIIGPGHHKRMCIVSRASVEALLRARGQPPEGGVEW